MRRDEVLGLGSEVRQGRLLLVELLLEGKNIGKFGAPVFSNMAEGKIADVHAVHDEWPRHPEDHRSFVGRDLRIHGQDGNLLATKEPFEHGADELGRLGAGGS
jgi:hypothetical protein